MINLSVKFSLEYEVQRVKETLGKLLWYKEKGYKVRLPEKLIMDYEVNISEDQIKNSISAEYEEGDYKKQRTFLLENWQKIIDESSIELAKTRLIPKDVYIVYLTKYGVGGSYHYPDVIIANIKSCYEVGLLRTTFHEILHLIIHPWITKYKISHWQKERIVDLLMMKFVPKQSKSQQLPIETEPIDKIFNKYYPDIELIIKSINL